MRLTLAFAMLVIMVAYPSCSTGIEGTKKIKLSRHDQRSLTPQPEDSFMETVTYEYLGQWRPGKSFAVLSPKVQLLMSAAPGASAHIAKGDRLSFAGVSPSPMPDGRYKAVIAFAHNGDTLFYNTNREFNDALQGLASDAIPMLVDMDMVDKADQLIRGQRLWTRSASWLDTVGSPLRGRRFVAVTALGVRPGSEAFPAMIAFCDESGAKAMTPLNLGSSGGDSRQFAELFFLSDPRQRYHRISDANWALIQMGRVAQGMTKEECRLSLGNPDESMSGHDYSQTLDIWKYQDGSVLRFADGVLLDFRR